MKRTKLTYLKNPSALRQRAVVIESGSDEKGHFIITDCTPAYPQGGGQESDRGFVISGKGEFHFTDAKLVDGSVKHYLLNAREQFEEGSEIEIVVDTNLRVRNSILHSAGHLVASVAFQIFSELIPNKGHHFSDGSYVELIGELQMNPDLAKVTLQSILHNEIKTEKVVSVEMVTHDELRLRCPFIQPSIPNDKPLRIVNIESFFPIRCGGTHVDKLNEIPNIQITRLKVNKDIIRISYSC
ncbi:MAG: hypothetical protein K1X54_11310 [Flavobacteriales bacterium]|nr:hypothetical protein [Flavobacteriales bacterium]